MICGVFFLSPRYILLPSPWLNVSLFTFGKNTLVKATQDEKGPLRLRHLTAFTIRRGKNFKDFLYQQLSVFLFHSILLFLFALVFMKLRKIRKRNWDKGRHNYDYRMLFLENGIVDLQKKDTIVKNHWPWKRSLFWGGEWWGFYVRRGKHETGLTCLDICLNWLA